MSKNEIKVVYLDTKAAGGSYYFLTRLFSIHITHNTHKYIALKNLPSMDHRTRTIESLVKINIIKYNDSKQICKIRTDKSFLVDALSCFTGFSNTYKLFCLAKKNSTQEQKLNLSHEDLEILENANQYLSESKDKNKMAHLYLSCLVLISKSGKNRLENDIGLCKKKNLQSYRLINIIETTENNLIPNSTKHIYGVELNFDIVSEALFCLLTANISKKAKNPGEYVIEANNRVQIYQDMLSLRKNEINSIKYNSTFWETHNIKSAIRPNLACFQKNFLNKFSELTNIVQKTGGIEPINQWLEDIKKEICEMQETIKDTKT